VTKVHRVQARTVCVPLPRTTSFSSRTVDRRWYSLVRVIDDDGVVGIGFCYAGSDGGSLPSVAVRDLFSDVLVGEDSDRSTGLWDDMYHKALLHGRTGSVMRALSAIDIALWDLKARRASRPLWKHLGAHAERAVPAYASGGYYLDGKTADDLGHELQGYIDAGYRAVKIKVGFVPPEVDVARIAVARDVLGPERLLMLDANNAWRDVPTALRALRMWEPFDPYWIEEPFSPDDITNHAALAGKTPILVATGEIEAGRWRHFELLRRDAAAILQTDAAVCGGITEFMRIAHLADGFGVTMAPHWFHDLHVHLVASISNGSWVEVFPGSDVLNFGDLIDRRVEVLDGQVVLPDDPGIGFDFDEAGVEKFATEPWS
jgi:L-alanine-DL-glutamate epimerase-like enolase superfamily enzyme